MFLSPKTADAFFVACFTLHDALCDWMARHWFFIKRTLLAVAFLSLFFVMAPSLRRSVGNLAETMLVGILFLSPLATIFRMRLLALLMGLRREFGILMGCFALVHGAAYFVDPASFSQNIAPYLNASFFSMQPLFYFGIVALALTLPLLFTSNNVSVRLLGSQKWKHVHRIVYTLLFVVLLHVLFLRGMRSGYTRVDWLQPASIIIGYLFLKVLAWKNFVPFLCESISNVSARYDQYVLIKKGSVSQESASSV
jgi:DMSO/TMAO reductase YedYZ heme-binding membrane subunit